MKRPQKVLIKDNQYFYGNTWPIDNFSSFDFMNSLFWLNFKVTDMVWIKVKYKSKTIKHL